MTANEGWISWIKRRQAEAAEHDEWAGRLEQLKKHEEAELYHKKAEVIRQLIANL